MKAGKQGWIVLGTLSGLMGIVELAGWSRADSQKLKRDARETGEAMQKTAQDAAGAARESAQEAAGKAPAAAPGVGDVAQTAAKGTGEGNIQCTSTRTAE